MLVAFDDLEMVVFNEDRPSPTLPSAGPTLAPENDQPDLSRALFASDVD